MWDREGSIQFRQVRLGAECGGKVGKGSECCGYDIMLNSKKQERERDGRGGGNEVYLENQ